MLGVCSSGGKVVDPLRGLVDFPIDDLDIDRRLPWSAVESEILRRIPDARSWHRGHFTGFQAALQLEQALVAEHETLQRELETLETIYQEHIRHFQESGADKAKLDGARTLHERARSSIQEDIERLKPSRASR